MAHARDELILDVLRSSGSATVAELAGDLDVGEATVRRALQRLANDGRILRTYGGAAVRGAPPGLAAHPGGDPLLPRKRAIGAAAAGLVREGSTVALSSGSTVLELARRLHERHLTVITNALDVAFALLDAPHIELVVLGGVVLPGVHSLRGHLAEEAMRDLRADSVFMGVSGIDLERGFLTEQVREISVDRALRGMAREAVILADSSKFDRVAPGFMFGFEQVSMLVTDEHVLPDHAAVLKARGTDLVIAKEGAPAEAR
jgi:DeoR/GlpR family transcriptional regulator of sugar metabolism